jgi:hypothetical protein
MSNLLALHNAANSVGLIGLKVHEKFNEDKRRSIKKYFLTHCGMTISPVLNYDNMNHFILGFSKAKDLLK